MPKKISSPVTDNPEQEKPEFFSQKVEDTIPPLATISKRTIKAAKTKNIKKQIATIYENAETLMPPPPKSSKKTKILIFIIFILAFLSAVSWAGFFMFGRGSAFDENKINLSATTDSQPIVGENFSYQVKIKNEGRVALNSSSLSLRYPQGFEFVSSEPVANDTDGKEWDLGSLNPGQEIDIEIKGSVWDNAASENNLQMVLSYRPGDLNVEFQKVSIFKTNLSAPAVNLETDSPSEGNAGSEIPFTISLTNQTEKDLNNLEVSLTLPEGFKNNSSFWKDNTFFIATLPAASSTLLSASVLPTGSVMPGPQQIKINLNAQNEGKSFNLQTLTKEININKSALSLTVAANGETNGQAVNFGDKMTFAIAYENTGNTELKNAVLRLVMDTPSADNKSLFDWTQIQDKYDGTITGEQISPTVRRAIITWDKSQIPQLADIKIQDKNSLEITLPLKQKTSLNLAKLTEFKTTVFSEILTNNNSASTAALIQSNNLELFLNSDLNLTSSATFKENKNLPLQIGKNEYDTKSIYSITWELTNSLHELTDLQLTATLPENVDWEKNSSATAGDITYDDTTKQITWKLNRLPTSFPKVTINFDLGLKSSDTDSGKQMVLMEKTRIEAKDKITEQNILSWKDPIITIP